MEGDDVVGITVGSWLYVGVTDGSKLGIKVGDDGT